MRLSPLTWLRSMGLIRSVKVRRKRAAPRTLAIETLEELAMLAVDITIDNASPGEGAGSAVLTVQLSEAHTAELTVAFATSDDTAVEPGDYTSTSDTVTFEIGQTTQQITIALIDDSLDEDNESFNVVLSSASAGTITDDTGVVTITDNDATPTLSVNDQTVVEANSISVDAVFTVSLSAVSGRTVTVNYATANGTATTSASDYSSASGTLTFSPGDSTALVTVQVLGDTLKESDETFKLNLASPNNATLANSQGLGTIRDNDAVGQMSSLGK